MQFTTCDLCDAHEDQLAAGTLTVLPPVYRPFGKLRRFHGQAVTLKVFEDNVLVRAALSSPGEGRVLVVDGGGSLRCALVGGNLGQLAQRNGWAGLIVHGCVRDCAELDACEIGVRALGVHPQRSLRKGEGQRDVPVAIAGVTVRPGQWIYADEDGVLVALTSLLD